MNIEGNRLNTFMNWPSSAPVDRIRIAKAGFFYTGQGTEVQCFSCGWKISEWNYGDQVMCRHRTLEPNCPFVVNPEASGNIPVVGGQDCPEADSSTSARAAELPDSSQSQDYGLIPEDELYRTDALRMLSFVNWTVPSPRTRQALARAGFYRTADCQLRCAWCGGELADFESFELWEDPLAVHRMYFPRCSFAANLPIETTPSRSYTPPLSEPSHPQSSGAIHNTHVLATGGTWRDLGVVGGSAKHPFQTSLATRLRSYNRWPTDRTQTPKELAEAGFFYTGADDQVRCFYCDGGLGRWEAADSPWMEHARWFPHCGYVLLVKGQQFVDACKAPPAAATLSAESNQPARRRNHVGNYPVTDALVAECMEGEPCMAALGAGLDAARVRRAIVRRLRYCGQPFASSEALIDAVLNEQLNEEAWSVSPRSQRLARDILAETLRDFAPRAGLIPSSQEESSDDRTDSPPLSPAPRTSQVSQPLSQSLSQPLSQPQPQPQPQTDMELSPEPAPSVARESPEPSGSGNREADERKKSESEVSLEEENRRLKEARLCKVCMDCEVSVVFLPCGHLVSCGGCGAALAACPLCRCAVRALVRAYLA